MIPRWGVPGLEVRPLSVGRTVPLVRTLSLDQRLL